MIKIDVAQKCSDFDTMQFSWSDIAFCIPAQSGGGGVVVRN